MDTHLMLGNEAVAWGAWESGAQVAAAYPGVTALCTTPSYGLHLADKAKERGIGLATDSKLRIGLFGAEPWPESGRDRLRAALGVAAFNEYGMGEFLGPGMACECPAGGADEEDRPPLGPRTRALLWGCRVPALSLLTIAGAVLWTALVVAAQMVTHVQSALRPGMSGLATGRYGWLMKLAFVVRGLTALALVAAVAGSVPAAALSVPGLVLYAAGL